jgi:hypothetical protein
MALQLSAALAAKEKNRLALASEMQSQRASQDRVRLFQRVFVFVCIGGVGLYVNAKLMGTAPEMPKLPKITETPLAPKPKKEDTQFPSDPDKFIANAEKDPQPKAAGTNPSSEDIAKGLEAIKKMQQNAEGKAPAPEGDLAAKPEQEMGSLPKEKEAMERGQAEAKSPKEKAAGTEAQAMPPKEISQPVQFANRSPASAPVREGYREAEAQDMDKVRSEQANQPLASGAYRPLAELPPEYLVDRSKFGLD